MTQAAVFASTLLCLLTSVLAEAAACRDSGWTRYDGSVPYARYAKKVKRSQCRKEWTILVYMAADNDLTPYAYWDLYEMEAGFASGKQLAASSTAKSDLIVQLDTAGDTGIRRLHMFQQKKPYDTRLELEHFRKMREKDIRSPVVEKLPENGSETEAQRFQRFLEWGIREYPAEHYMVVLWGHGQGWGTAADAAASPFAGRGFGGIAFNESRGTYLDIPALKNALKEVSASSLGGRPFDVYASDACLMQMVEVATEISTVARFVVGSTQVQNFLGLPYRRMMSMFNAHLPYRQLMAELNTGAFAGEPPADYDGKNDEAYLIARMMPKVFRQSMEPQGLQGRFAPEGIKNVTMSSIATDELRGQLLPALQDVSVALEAWLREDPLRGGDLLQRLKDSPTVIGGAQELGAFLTLTRILLREQSEREGGLTVVSEKLDRELLMARDVLHRTVVAYALGTRYDDAQSQLYLLGFKAVSAWIPKSDREYRNRIATFEKSDFYALVPAWGGWLRALFAQ